MMSLPAFVVAIALLIAVHEYGHYRVAVACGVKVLRFSIGFGKPLWRWQPRAGGTEFVLALVPLGGYVTMLDEREAPVAPAQRHLAFNTQPLRSRFAIVAAGPLANLALAVLLYAMVNWIGVQQPAALLGYSGADSIASQAGLQAGQRVLRAGFDDQPLADVASFEDVRWTITRAVLEGRDVRLDVVQPPDGHPQQVLLRLSGLETTDIDAHLFEKIGVVAPFTRAAIGATVAQGAAAQAGLKEGDEVLAVNAQPMLDGQQLRALIRNSAASGNIAPQNWTVLRNGQTLTLVVTPKLVQEAGIALGRIGAYVGAAPEMVLVRRGPVDGLWWGFTQTWDLSALTLKMMGKMVIGQASIKNISGPLTIADYAGKSAGLGLTSYLTFLALISVSLGILNLLPVPVLDGGHLMYYLWEGCTGKAVPERWMQRLQHGGVAVLLAMMVIAVFNDIGRLLA